MKLAAFNVGPESNIYSGKHTYHDVWIPFLNVLARRRDTTVHWVGLSLFNRHHNPELAKMGVHLEEGDRIALEHNIKRVSDNKSWDMIDASEYDAFLCQPRPAICEIENQILFSLIRKFIAAGKPVFVWECDLFTDLFPEELRKECILLYPTEVPPTQEFKEAHKFGFFTHSEYGPRDKAERDFDFTLIANIYGRNAQALQFFEPMQKAPFRKMVFGSWVETEERREFSSQFEGFEFMGNTEFWAARPIMERTKATLHIVPDFARDRGLMTARVFTSQMAGALCFVDEGIIGAEKYFPHELIVKNGQEIAERWDSVLSDADRLLAERAELLKEHTVEKRVDQFITIYEEWREKN